MTLLGNPEGAAPIFEQYPNVITLQLWRILFVENSELDSVKTGQAFFGSEPHVSISCLCDRVNCILWQAVFSQPYLGVELREIAGGIKSQRLPANKAQQKE
jgi:hypothetical protein